jgi:hypothetical protein
MQMSMLSERRNGVKLAVFTTNPLPTPNGKRKMSEWMEANRNALGFSALGMMLISSAMLVLDGAKVVPLQSVAYLCLAVGNYCLGVGGALFLSALNQISTHLGYKRTQERKMSVHNVSQLSMLGQALGLSDLRMMEDEAHTVPEFVIFKWKRDGKSEAVKVPTEIKTVRIGQSFWERLLYQPKAYQAVDWDATADRFAYVIRAATKSQPL